jgi:hypothetical protein
MSSATRQHALLLGYICTQLAFSRWLAGTGNGQRGGAVRSTRTINGKHVAERGQTHQPTERRACSSGRCLQAYV